MSAPVCDAAEVGDLAEVKRLVEVGGRNIDERGRFGWTPLMRAAERGHDDIVRHLLHKGSDLSLVDDFGINAFMMAASCGHPTTIELLLDHGAALNYVDLDGMTALMWAAWCNRSQCVRLLLDEGANVHARDNDGQTARDWAEMTDEHGEVARILRDEAQKVPSLHHLASHTVVTHTDIHHLQDLPLPQCIRTHLKKFHLTHIPTNQHHPS